MRLAKMAADGFQPTLPARGATVSQQIISLLHGISTHAPRTGSDTTSFFPTLATI